MPGAEITLIPAPFHVWRREMHMPDAAIFYHPEGFDTRGKRLMGRHAAGEALLRGLARHGSSQILACCAAERSMFETFRDQITAMVSGAKEPRWVLPDDAETLREIGVLYRPDPVLSPLAWQRRAVDQRAYSLCGITHTIASKETMRTLGDLLTDPLHAWDALICTSQAVRTMVQELQQAWSAYLEERLGVRPHTRLQLPVIPLGVDCAALAPAEAGAHRARLRASLGIGPKDIVVLFVGRLIFHAKANPAPMFQALEKAARAVPVRLHLIQAGWFEDAQQEAAFTEAAGVLAPSVTHHVLDGRTPDIRAHVWHAADIFLSLSDNIQETFGLTPIEAMAAGLPCIVSDWDGYKETVRHEQDGFRIPTILAPPRCALDLAREYASDSMNYSTYIGHMSTMAAVDVDACAQALTTLAARPELRQTMGESGRRRAREIFDWRVIINAYEHLWAELGEIRAMSPAPPTGEHPLCADPCRVFRHYPTTQLSGHCVLALGDMAGDKQALERMLELWMVNFGATRRAPRTILDGVMALLTQSGPMTVADILARFTSGKEQDALILARSLVYMLKFDLLKRIA